MSSQRDKFKAVLKALENDRIGGMVVGDERRNDPEFIAEQIQLLHLSPSPIFQSELADFYIAQNNLTN